MITCILSLFTYKKIYNSNNKVNGCKVFSFDVPKLQK